MTDFVEIPDDNSSDNEVHDQQPQPVTATNHAFDELRSLKSEMEFRGSLLGKTWSELSNIMTRYQAQIIQKHEQLDNSLSGADHFRLTQQESELKKCRTENVRLKKQVTDLESKILEKDSEIVQLRTDFHKAKNEVMMKDNLIQKIQAQMAQEALDYQTEISALKDILEQGQGGYGGEQQAFVQMPMTSPQPKRRKVIPKPPMPRPQMVSIPSPRKPAPQTSSPRLPSSNTPTKMEIPSSASSVKSESFQTACQMSGPSTSQLAGQNEMDSSYTDQSFNEPQDDGSGQEQSFFKVDEVYDDSNSGMEGLMQGQDASMLLEGMQPGGQEQMTSRTRTGEFECNVCYKRFLNAGHLKRHRDAHFGIKPFRCIMCLKCFGVRYHAVKHVRTVHKRPDGERLVERMPEDEVPAAEQPLPVVPTVNRHEQIQLDILTEADFPTVLENSGLESITEIALRCEQQQAKTTSQAVFPTLLESND